MRTCIRSALYQSAKTIMLRSFRATSSCNLIISSSKYSYRNPPIVSAHRSRGRETLFRAPLCITHIPNWYIAHAQLVYRTHPIGISNTPNWYIEHAQLVYRHACPIGISNTPIARPLCITHAAAPRPPLSRPRPVPNLYNDAAHLLGVDNKQHGICLGIKARERLPQHVDIVALLPQMIIKAVEIGVNMVAVPVERTLPVGHVDTIDGEVAGRIAQRVKLVP